MNSPQDLIGYRERWDWMHHAPDTPKMSFAGRLYDEYGKSDFTHMRASHMCKFTLTILVGTNISQAFDVVYSASDAQDTFADPEGYRGSQEALVSWVRCGT